MRKLLVLLILLAIALVGTDRALLYGAESELAKRVSQQYPMDAEPDVDIGGFPFLTQAFGGTYSEINLVTGAFAYEEIQFERIDVTLYDVEAPLADLMTSPTASARSAEGTALLPYSELQRRLPEGLSIEQEGGEPRISGDLAIQGFSVPVESGIEISVADSVLTVTPTDIEIGEAMVDLGGVGDELAFDFPVDDLPFDLAITDVEALPNGVQITVEGTDIPLVA
ncbi:DUF2993 domain-containing protein [Spiractinospora alimapuensis]|uniref:LmeA family phospholipid-binding protein n=1 Tax=Spiractinospora alimapuensis TaxID=2820884 RepID=UPI001F2588FD|nr:DUF2993 domain-containing protein [Spiractinospora alimapuensis]QVQ50627.1 DUF2993 domain-containing protein [Spiractinospora alimapuensis]